jgi:hypothetical protein
MNPIPQQPTFPVFVDSQLEEDHMTVNASELREADARIQTLKDLNKGTGAIPSPELRAEYLKALAELPEPSKPVTPALPPACTLQGTDRKSVPVYRGFMMYFPKAIQEIARLSLMANEQHNPGTEMHWDRSKSGDERDAEMRHALDAGSENIYDDDGHLHATKKAWRAMADLEKLLEDLVS